MFDAQPPIKLHRYALFSKHGRAGGPGFCSQYPSGDEGIRPKTHVDAKSMFWSTWMNKFSTFAQGTFQAVRLKGAFELVRLKALFKFTSLKAEDKAKLVTLKAIKIVMPWFSIKQKSLHFLNYFTVKTCTHSMLNNRNFFMIRSHWMFRTYASTS